MGTKKQWTGQEKLAIVLQGMKGERSISELCNEHEIMQDTLTAFWTLSLGRAKIPSFFCA